MQHGIDHYLDRFETDRSTCSRELKALLRHDSEHFRLVVLDHVHAGHEGAALTYALWLLHQHRLLITTVLDPGLPTREAITIAKMAAPAVPNLDLQLANVLKTESDAQMTRALSILGAIPVTTRILPVLTAALPQFGPNIRSRIALLYGRVCQNTLFTSRLRVSLWDG